MAIINSSGYYLNMIDDYNRKIEYYNDIISKLTSIKTCFTNCEDSLSDVERKTKEIIVNNQSLDMGKMSEYITLLCSNSAVIDKLIKYCNDIIDDYNSKITGARKMYNSAVNKESQSKNYGKPNILRDNTYYDSIR